MLRLVVLPQAPVARNATPFPARPSHLLLNPRRAGRAVGPHVPWKAVEYCAGTGFRTPWPRDGRDGLRRKPPPGKAGFFREALKRSFARQPACAPFSSWSGRRKGVILPPWKIWICFEKNRLPPAWAGKPCGDTPCPARRPDAGTGPAPDRNRDRNRAGLAKPHPKRTDQPCISSRSSPRDWAVFPT